jgi:hypothetical protein
MDERIEKLEQKIDKLTEIVNNQVVRDCKKMSDHITFIENVYTTVKSPLEYVCSYFTTTSLPSPENLQLKDK